MSVKTGHNIRLLTSHCPHGDTYALVEFDQLPIATLPFVSAWLLALSSSSCTIWSIFCKHSFCLKTAWYVKHLFDFSRSDVKKDADQRDKFSINGSPTHMRWSWHFAKTCLSRRMPWGQNRDNHPPLSISSMRIKTWKKGLINHFNFPPRNGHCTTKNSKKTRLNVLQYS